MSLLQVVTGLGKPREYLAVGFLFPWVSRWMLSASSTGCKEWKCSGFSPLSPVSSGLLGCSWENHGTVDEPLKKETWWWGEGIQQRIQKQIAKKRDWSKMVLYAEIVFHLKMCHCILHSPRNISGAPFSYIVCLLLFTSRSSFPLNYVLIY